MSQVTLPLHTPEDDVDQEPSFFTQEMELPSSQKTLSLPKIWITKGLMYPFDAGFSLAQHGASGLGVVAGYLQLNLYEALAMPALALRLGTSKLLGLSATSAHSQSVEALASWGLWFASLYGGYGLSRHELIYQDTPTELREPFQTLGLQLQVLPPFMILALEAKHQGSYTSGQTFYHAKLSVGL